MTSSALSPLNHRTGNERLKNWSGNLEYSTSNVFYPKSVEEVQQFVKESDKCRPLGTRHCFNRIADSKDYLVSLTELNKVVSLNTDTQTVTVDAGIKYGELCPYLDENGFALHNLASLPHISVAGSIATATHGSGIGNGNLATAVTALEMVTADGNVVNLSKDKDGESFLAAVVGLGAFGVVTKVTLAVEPKYTMRQQVYVGLPLSQLHDHFVKIVSAGYSVSLFTNWQTAYINEVWIKTRDDNGTHFDPSTEFFGAKAATIHLHPISEMPAENCTEQLGIPGPWFERLPHFKMGYTPSSGVELQSEYFVSLENAVDAIRAIQRLGNQIGRHLFISEIRTIAADNFWMSPCRRQSSVAIHFTWKQDWEAVSKLLPLIEKELEPFKPKPHWGKLFTMSPKVLGWRYDMLHDFKKMVGEYDPGGKFRNKFLGAHIFAD